MQELDTALDALRLQAANPPEAAELKELTATRADLEGRARDLQVLVDDLTREQRKADADVETVKIRRVRDQQRLDSGAVTSPKDLQRLQHELVSLDRRISDLEDAELEVMEQLETAQGELAQLRSRVQQIDERLGELVAARDKRVSAIRDQAVGVKRDREAAVSGIPAELLALYDKLHAQMGGVGAAALRQRRCSGCSLELNSGDLGIIAKQPSDTVIRCEECGRILVRTAESGL